MIKKHKLIEARNKKGYAQDYLVGALNIDVSSYSRKENGKLRIFNQEWQTLSEILNVPLTDIYESDEGMMFIFNDQSSGVGNGIGNSITNYTIPQSIWESQKKYIEKLEEENQKQKEEIQQLKENRML